MGDGCDLGPVLFPAVTSDPEQDLSGYDGPTQDALEQQKRGPPTCEDRLDLRCAIPDKINEGVGQLHLGGGRGWVFPAKRLPGMAKPCGGVIDATRTWVED